MGCMSEREREGRERERDRKRERQCVCMCIYTYRDEGVSWCFVTLLEPSPVQHPRTCTIEPAP